MLARRFSPKFLFFAIFVSTVTTLYITRETWDSSRLGFDASQLAHWPLTSALQEELWPLLGTDDVTPALEGIPSVESLKPTEEVAPVADLTRVESLTPSEDFAPPPDSTPVEDLSPVENPAPVEDPSPSEFLETTEPIKDLESSEDAEPIKNLQSLCSQTAWAPGLWIQCHSNARRDYEGKRAVHGGLNNVRNRLQTCLRVAIDSGAGVIIPMVATRNQTQLKNLGGGEPVPASNFWNMEYMVEALGDQCPQMPVRFDMKGIKTMLKAPRRHYSEARYQNGTFGAMTRAVLQEGGIELSSISEEKPVAVSFGDTFLAWDYEKSNELSTVRKDLYRTLKYNQTLLDISSLILQAPQLHNRFIGVHLRAEADWPRSFGKASDQMRLYIEEIERLERKQPSDLKTLYVSSGSQEGIQIFREKVTPLGYEVHDKWSLLSSDPTTLAQVENLMFDEKAIIEYQMLLNADFFLGPVMSSMSSLIAFTRALDSEEDFFPTYIYPGSTKDVGEDGAGFRRTYEFQAPEMRGDKKSRLMIVDGDDIMSFFP